ncbi:hypothetical protein ABVT39_018027 [Epinephelus coioides]
MRTTAGPRCVTATDGEGKGTQNRCLPGDTTPTPVQMFAQQLQILICFSDPETTPAGRGLLFRFLFQATGRPTAAVQTLEAQPVLPTEPAPSIQLQIPRERSPQRAVVAIYRY